jgi:hypothetical protein
MSDGKKKVNCLKEECQLWFTEAPSGETMLGLSNCALAHLPLLVLEIATNTRLMKASMVESVAI